MATRTYVAHVAQGLRMITIEKCADIKIDEKA